MTDLLAAAKQLLHVLSGDHSQGEHLSAVEGLKAAVTAEDPAPEAAPEAPAEEPEPAAPASDSDTGAVTE